MRGLCAFLLVTGLCMPAFSAETPAAENANTSSSIPWYRRWFLGERDKPAPAPAPAPARAVAGGDRPAAARTAPAAAPQESAKAKYAEEHKIYFERLLAISRIREIAVEQNDEAMMKKADDLEAQAEEVFKLRTANLPKFEERGDDRAALERGRDERPASAARPASRRPSMQRNDR